ncbi:PadR family transcriptional regulator [bacterium]|nr:PadR family transcriptional regulator [bacterium]
METLSRSDEIFVLSILRLKDNAYGLTIVQEIEARTGKKITFGALWVSMDILAKKGLVNKRVEDPGKGCGRKKIYYTVTPEGVIALEATRELNKKLWRGMAVLINGTKGVS